MKSIFVLLLITIFLFGCTNDPNNYVEKKGGDSSIQGALNKEGDNQANGDDASANTAESNAAAQATVNAYLGDPNATINDLLKAVEIAQSLGLENEADVLAKATERIGAILYQDSLDPAICKKELLDYAATAQQLGLETLATNFMERADKAPELCGQGSLVLHYENIYEGPYGIKESLSFDASGVLGSDDQIVYYYEEGKLDWEYTYQQDSASEGVYCAVRTHKEGSGSIDLSQGKIYSDTKEPVPDIMVTTIDNPPDISLFVSPNDRYYSDSSGNFINPFIDVENAPEGSDPFVGVSDGALRVWHERIGPSTWQSAGETIPCEELPAETHAGPPSLDFFVDATLTAQGTSSGTKTENGATYTWDLKLGKAKNS